MTNKGITLQPGETVEFKFTVKILDESKSGKWWQFWKPIVWRDATKEELKKIYAHKTRNTTE